MMCPGCNNEVSPMERLTGVCSKDGASIHESRVEVAVPLPSATPCHAARSGEGYWTCDVLGGCSDCRSLAREISDLDTIAFWDSEKAAQPAKETP